MRFVDAHIHLSDAEYANCVDEILAESKKANVVALVANSMDLETSAKSLQLAGKYKGIVYAAFGIHPWTLLSSTDDELKRVMKLITQQRHGGKLVAIGEVGLDIKYPNIWDKQLAVFSEMVTLGERLDLPVIVHSGGTTAKIVDMLPSYNLKRVLLHWFSNPISALSKVVENGYFISEGPPVVYSSGIQDVVKRAPLANLLTETDGPVRFLRPPFKDRRTTPAFMPEIVGKIAEIKKLRAVDVAEQIVTNFESFFSVKLN